MNKKMKRFDDGGPVDPMEEANSSSEAQEIAGEEILKSMRDSETPKQRVVSKAELEKSGLSLRDFLNREQGLTRRGDMAPKSAPKVTDTGDEIARMKARAPKPALRQETYVSVLRLCMTKASASWLPNVLLPRKQILQMTVIARLAF